MRRLPGYNYVVLVAVGSCALVVGLFGAVVGVATAQAGGGTFTDTTVGDFGGVGADFDNAHLAETDDGEIMLQPILGEEFLEDTEPPDDWVPTEGWDLDAQVCTDEVSSAEVVDGVLTMNCSMLISEAQFGAGHSLEVSATFQAENRFQTIAFSNGSGVPWRAFDLVEDVLDPVDTGIRLRARGSNGQSFGIDGNPVDAGHRYRIDWRASGFDFYVDDALEQTLLSLDPADVQAMNVMIRDRYPDGTYNGVLLIDWVRLSPYAAAGVYTSTVFDAGDNVDWTDLAYTSTVPVDTSLSFETQTSEDGTTWSDWVPASSPINSPNGQYLRYRAAFSTSDPNVTPILEAVTIAYTDVPTSVSTSSLRAIGSAGPIRMVCWLIVPLSVVVGFALLSRSRCR